MSQFQNTNPQLDEGHQVCLELLSFELKHRLDPPSFRKLVDAECEIEKLKAEQKFIENYLAGLPEEIAIQ